MSLDEVTARKLAELRRELDTGERITPRFTPTPRTPEVVRRLLADAERAVEHAEASRRPAQAGLKFYLARAEELRAELDKLEAAP